MKVRHLRSHPAALIAAILIGFHVHAQTTAGRFSGTVLDPSGAPVPQTTVAALNKETGQKVVETTNSSGYFVLYPLLPGVYDITAQKQGFSTFVISDVQINVSESVPRRITLEVGAVNQSISVNAEAADILTDSPSISATIVRKQIEDLPR